MKAIKKEFYVDIRKTIGRFISIFLIVALGVGFYAGIRSTEPDMRLTGDKLYDESNLMDLKVISTMGLSDYDVEKISGLDCIEKAVGSYSADMIGQTGSNENVIRFLSQTEGINDVTVTNGRKPERTDECMVDQSFWEKEGLQEGDKLTVKSAGSREISEVLHAQEYTITGAFTSTQYMSSSTKGTSTVGNGRVEGLAIVPDDTFALDVYTEIYASVAGAKAAVSYTKEYDEIVEAAAEEIKEQVQEVCIQARYQELYQAATDGIKEIEAQAAEVQSGIDAGNQTIQNLQKQIKTAKSGIKKLENSIAEAETGKQQAEAAIAQLQVKVDAYDSYISRYSDLGYVPAGSLNNYDVPMEQLEREKQQYVDRQKPYQETIKSLDAGIKSCEEKIVETNEQIAQANGGIQTAKDEIAKAEAGLKELNLAKSDAEAAREELQSPTWYLTDRNAIQTYLDYDQDAERISKIGIVFPVIFFLVAMLVSLTTMTRMVTEQRTQIGTLKALGYSKFAIASKYIKYALLATVLGSAAGSVIGSKLLPVVILNTYQILYPSMHKVVTPVNLTHTLTATVIAIGLVLAATVFASYKTLAAHSAELMRPEAPKAGKKVLLERISFIWNHLGFYGKSTYRNMVRYKKRFFMTLFGVSGSMALLIVGFGLKDSTGEISTHQYGILHTYDASVSMNLSASEKRTEEARIFLEEDSRIADYMEFSETAVTVSNPNKELTVYAEVPKDVSALENYIILRDHKDKKTPLELEDGKVVITDKMARLLELEPGDTFDLELDETQKVSLTVSGITENYIYHYVYMNANTYRQIYGKEPTYNKLLMHMAEDTDQDALTEELLNLKAINSVSLTQTIQDKFKDVLKSIDIIVLVLLVSAGGLAFVVLYNLNNINIAERKRELATLKVLGFYDQEVTGYVYRENVLITILGIGVGCLLGILLHQFVIQTAEIDAITFYRQIKGMSFVYSALLTIIFSVIINITMYFKLKKIDLAASMKSIE